MAQPISRPSLASVEKEVIAGLSKKQRARTAGSGALHDEIEIERQRLAQGPV